MRNVLFILSEFTGQDIDWLIGAGRKEHIKVGDTLIHQGRHIKDVYFVLQGRCEIVVDGKTIVALGTGEMLGELSFLDTKPPNASVKVTETGSVLTVSVARLKSKLRTDTGFAARFYRGLGVMLAARLRDTVSQLAGDSGRQRDDDVEDTGELPVEMLESLSLAAAKFDDILARTK